jgi:transcriptional regulator with XRE-family HTH domain
MPKIVSNRTGELLALKKRRERRHITLGEIAEATGVATSTLWLYTNNRVSRYDSRILVSLCEYFGCELGELLTIEEVEASELGEDEQEAESA